MDIINNDLYQKAIDVTKKILKLHEKHQLPKKSLEEIVSSMLANEKDIKYDTLLPYLATTFAQHYYEIVNSNPLEIKRF